MNRSTVKAPLAAAGILLGSLLLTAHAQANTGAAMSARDVAAPLSTTTRLDLPALGELHRTTPVAAADETVKVTDARNFDQRLVQQLDRSDGHRHSRLRPHDDSGAHNDFRLHHNGNLLHIPLTRGAPTPR